MSLQTKQELAYASIREKIIAGELLPGQRIVTTRVARELQISPLPVREALVRLEAERLVAIIPHVGAVVVLVTTEEVAETIEGLSVLEGYATRLAHSRVSKLRPRLKEITNKMHRALEREEWEEFSLLNREFHISICERCGNQAVIDSVRTMWDRLDSMLSQTPFLLIPGRAQGSLDDHERISAMIFDPETDLLALELFAREHKMRTADHLRSEQAAGG